MPRLFIEAGCPIRRSPAKLARQQTEAYRSLATSFIGLQRLGIHRAPLVALITTPLPPQPARTAGSARLGSLRSLSIRLLMCFPAFRRASGPEGCSGRGVRGNCPLMRRPAWWADPLSTSAVLSLRYSVVKAVPVKYTLSAAGLLVEPGGLEPPTSALQRRRSPS